MLLKNQLTDKIMTSSKSLINILTNELDYNILSHALRAYRFPRNKIRNLLQSGELIRVKKGIYVKGGGSYSLPVLANMIYGPSYVSQHYALSFYGLIPERVHTVTSMTFGRHKRFETPLGVFTYEPLPERLYALAVRRLELSPTQPYLIASPEKAIIDLIWKRHDLGAMDTLERYLVDDLRLDLDQTNIFSLSRMRKLEKAYAKKPVSALAAIFAARNPN